jgi:hypothetical protein
MKRKSFCGSFRCITGLALFFLTANQLIRLIAEFKQATTHFTVEFQKTSPSAVEEDHQESHNGTIIKKKSPSPAPSSMNDENLSSPELAKSDQTATECLLNLERFVNKTMDSWLDQYVPFLMNSFLINGTYHLLFMQRQLNGTTQNRNTRESVWYCNGDLNLPAKPASSRYQEQFVVECPQTSAAPLTRIFNDGNSPSTGNRVVYDVSPYIKCDELARQEYMATITTLPLSSNSREEGLAKKTIGICTQLQGKDARHFASQWIEYHHMIGVDHIWLYINEEYNLTALPKRDYVTYVPNNFDLYEHMDHYQGGQRRAHYFQAFVQQECILKARQFNLDWVALTDVDEFIQVGVGNTSAATGPVLKDYLNSIPIADQQRIGGLTMNSIPYGTNSNAKHPSTQKFETMVFDYVWRNKKDPNQVKFARWKNIVKPWNINGYSIHYIKDGKPGVKKAANTLRINHYKKADTRVFQQSPNDLVVDSYLHDNYGDRIVEALKDVKEFTRNQIPRRQ